MSLRFKLTLTMIMTVTVAVGVALGLSIFSVRQLVERQFYKRVPGILASASIDLQSDLLFGYSRSEAWMQNPEVISWLNSGEPEGETKDSIMRRLEEFAAEDNIIASWVSSAATYNHYMTDAHRKVQYSRLMESEPADEWFFKTLKLTEQITFHINKNKETDVTGLWINAQVRNAQSKILAIVGVGLDLDTAVETMKKAVPSPNSVLLLADDDGNIIISSTDEQFGSSLKDYLPATMASVPEDVQLKTWHDARLGKMVYGERKIGSLPYKIIFTAPLNDFLPSVLIVARASILTTILIIVIVVIFAFFGVKGLTGRIVKIEEAFKAIASGDFTVQLPESQDEIGSIASHLNRTIAAIRHSFVSVRDESFKMRGVGNDLSSNMERTVSEIQHITATIDNVKNQALIQSGSVDAVAAALEAIVAIVEKLNTSIDTQASSVALSSSAIEQMTANIVSITQTLEKTNSVIKRLASATDDGKQSLAASHGVASTIAEESGSLLEASSVIQHIASQTNLLAMNAAIEAAHAGEAGKGFAVVADEIRKLAEESSMQGKNITATLKTLSGEIKNLSESSQTAEEKFNIIFDLSEQVKIMSSTLMEAMLEQEHGSNEVLTAIKDINTVTMEVQTGSEEMLKSGEKVTAEMRKLDDLTRTITESMNEMADGAVQINSAAQEVNEIAQKNTQSIDNLAGEVAQFKV
nr:methyl-accepting chemotaxis protein [uncultured Treponema sp.]